MEKYIILGHKNIDIDSIVSGILLEKLIKNKYKKNCEFVINEDISLEDRKICEKFSIDVDKYIRELNDLDNKIVLVDHSYRDFKDKEIVGIIDHHPKLFNNSVKDNINVNSSSTSCLIVRGNEKYFSKDEIILAILGAYIDTASFHSTKGLESDKKWCYKMMEKYNLDEKLFYNTGLILTDISNLYNAAFNGMKEYKKNNLVVKSSYVQITDVSNNKNNINTMLEYVRDYFSKSNLDGYIFIVLDMDNFSSTAYNFTKDNEFISYYSKYTSRGTVIVPELFDKLKK